MYQKYPRTPHLPWSGTIGHGDRTIKNTNQFLNKQVVVTEKMDGENTTMYRDHIHARSIDSQREEWRSWVANLHAQIKHLIPVDMRICGENMWAEHSIRYDNLESYFLVFAIIYDNGWVSGWDMTQDICKGLGLSTVPVLYEGQWNRSAVEQFEHSDHEGYVVRVLNAFRVDQFDQHVAKWVRPDHVQTSTHWRSQAIRPNLLRAETC